MLYLIESPAMKISSEGEKIYYSIYKVGYASNLEKRFKTYKSSNPFCNLIDEREGSLEDEQILHYILRGLGLSIEILSEWYKYDDKVKEIFQLPMEELKKMLWENRNKYFPKGMLHISTSDNNKFRSISHKIFSDLYEEFVPEEEKLYFGEDVYLGKDCQIISQEVLEIDRTYRQFLDLKNKKVSQKVYQDSVMVTKSIESLGITSSELQNLNSEEKLLDVFLERFFSTRIFKFRLRIYCEFMDEHQKDPILLEVLNKRIKDLKYFRYYSFYGTKGCKSRGYVEKNLIEGLKTNLQTDNLKEVIMRSFIVGERYTKSEIKEILGKIFNDLGIADKKPKATLLLDYFEMSGTKITLPDKTLVNGYKILGKKK